MSAPAGKRTPFLHVLGIAQDAGLPQAGCQKPCCERARRNSRHRRKAVCLALIDPRQGKRWLIDATPDFREQLASLGPGAPDGIFLTHGHMGHYTGLLHLGREAMDARGVPVHAMPRMKALLRNHAPWEQLVRLRNIELRGLRHGVAVRLGEGLAITPIRVPHRAEYTETVAYRIEGPRRSALWLPDIDRWESWDTRLEDAIAGVDAAWLDATFYTLDELPGRPASEIPHPPMAETLARLAPLPRRERAKVRFMHLNHTNPAHDPKSAAARAVKAKGFRVAREGETFPI
ncbi:MAG: MBL fold metallo-hydrolase [Planctomycetes bacterium]|nr:MBL fold metallo-hydrolase [Planctomycetota bacterium]